MTTAGPPDTDAQDPSPSPGFAAGVRTSVRELGGSIAAVFRNPGLRRVELALVGSMIGDWAFATAVVVWAYSVGGVTAVGVWTAIRLTLMALTAPFASTLVDRLPRKRVMVASDLLRLVLVTAAGVCLVLDTPAAPIFVLATLAGLLGTPFRCAQRSLMPALASTPEELTASNGTGSTIESLSFFIGPMLGALLIAASSVEVVFFLNAITFAWSMVMVLGIHVPHRDEPDRPTSADPDDEPAKESFAAEVSGGFRAIAADRDLAVVIWLVSAQTIVAGASAVFLVVMAVDVLGTGPEGVGYLDSILGVGAILGGFFAISRASKRSLAQDLTVGVVLWAAPLLLITAWASPVTVLAAVALLGFANPLVDVNLDTIVQRLAPDAVMGRVFGALETCVIATMALGAALMPVLMNAYGLRTSLAVVGVGVTALSLPFLPRMRRLDERLTAPAGLDLLTAIPMFVPLTPATVDGLARKLVRVTVPASGVVVTEGEESDRFFIIESGLVDVMHDGAVLRQEGPGDFFGEIGLLRDVPRTATVVAVADTVLLALGRDDFLAAVTGQSEAFRAADDVVSFRLTV
ncbi:MFS transporter [Nocardioides zhouii]|uniref:MFS transporter n=1 Tax=Nocardioides zhouii TaxID=1168729 RepID=A0A4V1RNE6_9ACTN|nr:MFS transporter [Nocardioides zhouii]RYC05587.1 MFS transporter [Nocardioides zhouii]